MIKNRVYLAQTDTTVGFLSNNDKKLSSIKKRSSSQKMLQVVDSYNTLKQQVRIPKKHRKLVRHASKTTFIYQDGNSYRVVNKKNTHHKFIKKFGVMYSTSANLTQNSFDKQFAASNSDVIVEDSKGFYETTPSKIIKLYKTKLLTIR